MDVSSFEVLFIRELRFRPSWVGVTSSSSPGSAAAAAAAEQGGEPARDGGLPMFGMGIGHHGVRVAGADDLAVIAGTADAAMEIGGLGAATDEGGGGIS